MSTTRRSMVSPHRELSRLVRDRQIGHAALMASLPAELGQDPRAKVNALWRYLPDEVQVGGGGLIVQADCPIKVDVLGELIDEEELPRPRVGSRWMFNIAMNCQVTPPSDIPIELRTAIKASGHSYRSRKVIVAEGDRPEWCCQRLARYGFAVATGSLRLSTLAYADLGRRGGGIPFIEASGTGTVTDADAWSQALVQGIGSGRNFGLGLILTKPANTESTVFTDKEKL